MNTHDNLICQEGFVNVSNGGGSGRVNTGFEFMVRSPSHKIVYLSLLEQLKVTVDGREFSGGDVRLSLDGYAFYDESAMRDMTATAWMDEPAWIRVAKPGGLSCGMHEIQIELLLNDVMPTVYRTWGATRVRAKRSLTLTEQSAAEKEGRIEFCVSAFCYIRDEKRESEAALKHLMKTTADMRCAGVEIIPEMAMPGFPAIANPFAASFHEWQRLYGVRAICLSSHNTMNPRGKTHLTTEEGVRALKELILYAERMGFAMIRTNDTPPEVLYEAIPFAEAHDIYLGFEIHPPITLDSDIIARNLEVIRKTGTKHFGFIPDLGIYVLRIAPLMQRNMIGEGARPEIIHALAEMYARRAPKAEAERYAEEAQATPYERQCLNKMFACVCDDPRLLMRILPYIIEVHAKFYEVNERYEETSVDYDNTLGALIRAGYRGCVCVEYEGHWHTPAGEEVPSQEQVRRLLHMMRTKYGSGLEG